MICNLQIYDNFAFLQLVTFLRGNTKVRMGNKPLLSQAYKTLYVWLNTTNSYKIFYGLTLRMMPNYSLN